MTRIDSSILLSFLKKNKGPLVILNIGILLFVLGLAMDTNYVIASTTRLIFYCSFFFISLGLYLSTIKSKKVVLANLLLVLLLMVVVEISCFFVLGMPSALKKDFQIPQLSEDHIARNVGMLPYADSVYHKVKVFEKDTVFDVHYSINSKNLRITPDFDSSKKQHALFFGCSLVYGTGVEDNETLPYQFQKISEEHNAYNYAFEGHGTNHMLARLQFEDLSDEVVETEGIAIYVFFWDHIYRSIGSMDRYCDWLYFAPYYTLQNDELVRKKMFKDGRPILSGIYEQIYQTNIVKQFKLDFPTSLNERHFNLVAEMILQSKIEYSKQFNSDDFYVLFPPVLKAYPKDDFEEFKSILSDKGVAFIDMSEYMDYGILHTLIGDPHPNPETHIMNASELLIRLNTQK